MLGHKQYSRFIENKLGHKLTQAINSLGTKHTQGNKTIHHNNNQELNHEQKQVKSYLEKR